MSEKQDLINKMLEMQKKFIAIEQSKGMTGEDYFNTEEMKQYRAEYMEMADKVVNLAHAEKGSLRE